MCSIPQIIYAAVDCTKGQNHELCKQEGVEGYPTFNHYNYGKFVDKYKGERGVSGSSLILSHQSTENLLTEFSQFGAFILNRLSSLIYQHSAGRCEQNCLLGYISYHGL